MQTSLLADKTTIALGILHGKWITVTLCTSSLGSSSEWLILLAAGRYACSIVCLAELEGGGFGYVDGLAELREEFKFGPDLPALS